MAEKWVRVKAKWNASCIDPPPAPGEADNSLFSKAFEGELMLLFPSISRTNLEAQIPGFASEAGLP